MKLTKNDLKQIVKECLVEILSEGIGASLPSINEIKNQLPKKRNIMPHSSITRQNSQSVRVHSNALKEAIKIESAGNSIMASILADTAAHSLPTMLESDVPGKFNPKPTGTVERVVASTSPEDLFGEDVASKWASLAFSTSSKK